MQALPHKYSVTVAGTPSANLTVNAPGLPPMEIAPPAQFGGPGNIWSPEDLLMASISNCFVLSFRAISRASKLQWVSIECETSGDLERIENTTKFTRVHTEVALWVTSESSIEKAQELLKKAERTCLITNSLSCKSSLTCIVETV